MVFSGVRQTSVSACDIVVAMCKIPSVAKNGECTKISEKYHMALDQ